MFFRIFHVLLFLFLVQSVDVVIHDINIYIFNERDDTQTEIERNLVSGWIVE